MDMTERNDALFLLSMRLHHHGVISCKDTTFFQYFQIYTKKTATLLSRARLCRLYERSES